jgi:hypothetical protein
VELPVDNKKNPALLIRLEQTMACTRGALVIDGTFICMTLERPWLDNKRNVSCITPGWYTCRRIHSPRFGETFEVCDVPGRTHILFHAGNKPGDTEGCILTGQTLPPLVAAIRDSKLALNTLMHVLQGVDSFPLEIV